MVNGNQITCSEHRNGRREIVRECYLEQPTEWHKFTHKRGGTVEENIQDTLDSMDEASKMYIVTVGKELAAFFVRYEGKSGMALEGFHVKKEYRSKEFLSEFWKIVRGCFGGVFYVGIWEGNKPAIEHLPKAGFIQHTQVIDKGRNILIFKS